MMSITILRFYFLFAGLVLSLLAAIAFAIAAAFAFILAWLN